MFMDLVVWKVKGHIPGVDQVPDFRTGDEIDEVFQTFYRCDGVV